MIDEPQQNRVIKETEDRVRQAAHHFGRSFAQVPVVFDLKGKAAGMYRVQNGEHLIRYNPYIFARYFDDNLSQTVPHEVAHYIADMIYGFRNIRPHGPEWKDIMRLFGAEPRASCSYDLAGLPLRNYTVYNYRCQCQQHALTSIRHNRIQRNQTRYYCKQCGSRLVIADPVE